MADSNRPGVVVLRGVTVVDTRTGSLTPDLDVTLTDGRIARITPSAARKQDRPDGAPAPIDAAGKYVVPGYLEMHTHVLGPDYLARDLQLMLRTGITGFRLMSGSDKLLKQRRDGKLPLSDDTPELLSTPGAVLNPANAGTVRAAVTTVREQYAAGADFIKTALVSAPVFFAAQAEAQRLGLPIVGHLPAGIDVRAASKGGIRSIEHRGAGTGVLVSCSTDEAKIRAQLRAEPGMKAPPFRIPFADKVMGPIIKKIVINPVLRSSPLDVQMLRRAIDTFDQGRAEELAAQFVADGTWHCPDPDPRADQRALRRARVPRRPEPAVHGRADPGRLASGRGPVRRPARRDQGHLPRRLRPAAPPDQTAGRRRGQADRGQRLVRRRLGGARLQSLHEEFDQLARGLRLTLWSSQTATLDAAEFLGREDTLGTVEPGKEADLVLLNEDPVENVQNLHAIAGVVRGGRGSQPMNPHQLRGIAPVKECFPARK